MSPKIPVRLPKLIRTAYLFHRLRQCHRCGAYSSLNPPACPVCGGETWQPVAEIAKAIERKHAQTELLILGTIVTAAYIASRSFKEMAAALLVGVVLLVVHALIRRHYAPYLLRRTIRRSLLQNHEKIRQGLLNDIEQAESDLAQDNYPAAYEKFREIGFFLKDNPIRILQLACLNRFILRSDMDLELDSLIPERFDGEFAAYLLDICRVKPGLIGRASIEYTVKYRQEFERLPYGEEILIAAAGAALRVRAHLPLFRGLVLDYAERLPEDRLHRLHLLASERAALDRELFSQVEQIWNLRYGPLPPAAQAEVLDTTYEQTKRAGE
ncbi:hypothetical protein RAC89_20230 [Paenibacillus sp. GD4]|uniref:hypothetical protein n=1 Tax=Paenibacillus sp. GD4 TaxID=3068890 RepID=UPI00279692C7|nr:hypothetical protein [Paenibacillus sp. GD4]MDQ1912721.1 hypothetical protein [Paenibacillus sp. GD4]